MVEIIKVIAHSLTPNNGHTWLQHPSYISTFFTFLNNRVRPRTFTKIQLSPLTIHQCEVQTILVSFPSIDQCGWQHSRYQVDVPKNVPTDYTLVHLCKTKFTMTTLLIQHIPHHHQHSMPSTCFHWSHIPLQPLQLHHHVRTTKSQVHSFDGCLHPPITHCLNDTHATKSLIIPSLGFVLWEVYYIGPIPHILFELKCLHQC